MRAIAQYNHCTKKLIAGFKKDENLRFAEMKDFWTKFLSGNKSPGDFILGLIFVAHPPINR